jgi:hypothetical protein
MVVGWSNTKKEVVRHVIKTNTRKRGGNIVVSEDATDQRTNRCHVPDWWRSGAGRSIGNGDGGGGTDGIVAEQCHFSKTFSLSQRDQVFPKVRVVFRGTQQCPATGFVILNQLVGVVVLCGGRKENKRRETEERERER